MSYKKGMRADTLEQTLRLFSEVGQMTYRDLAELAGISTSPATERLRKLTDAGLVHICDYVIYPVSPACPIYALGKAPNAPHPGKVGNVEKQRRHRAKMKTERPEEWAAMIRRQWENRKRKEAADPTVKAARQRQKTAWQRQKNGHTPRALLDLTATAEVAMQMGNTWFFSREQLRKTDLERKVMR